MDISNAVRAGRKKAGLTQVQLAHLMGVTAGAVARWEGGGGGNGITDDNLAKLARILQIPASALLGEDIDLSERVTNPKELALLEAFRALSGAMQDIHLKLIQTQVIEGTPAQKGGRPAKRSGVGS